MALIEHYRLLGLIRLTINLYGCHNTEASLLSLVHNPGATALQQNNGFRQYVRNYCLANGVSGYIRRTYRKNIELVAEGTHNQLQQFTDWLNVCGTQGMFRLKTSGAPIPIFFRDYGQFSVAMDESRPYHVEADPNGVIRGTWSDNRHERLSEYSATNYRGGHPRSYGGSGGSGSGNGSDGGSGGNTGGGGYLRKGSGTGGKSSSKIQLAGQISVNKRQKKA